MPCRLYCCFYQPSCPRNTATTRLFTTMLVCVLRQSYAQHNALTRSIARNMFSNIMIPSELRSHWAKSWPKLTISSLRLIRLDNLEPTHGSRNSYDRIIHLSRTFAYHTVRVTYIPSFLWNHEYTTNDINTINMADRFPCPPSDRPCARGHIRRLSSV